MPLESLQIKYTPTMHGRFHFFGGLGDFPAISISGAKHKGTISSVSPEVMYTSSRVCMKINKRRRKEHYIVRDESCFRSDYMCRASILTSRSCRQFFKSDIVCAALDTGAA